MTIEAEFSGKDKSCGFRNGHTYKLQMVNGHMIKRVGSSNDTAVPYESIRSFLKNWTNVKVLSLITK